jgi:hypothetical protein
MLDLTGRQLLFGAELRELRSAIEDAITKICGLIGDPLGDPKSSVRAERQRAAGVVREYIEQRYFPTPRQRKDRADDLLLFMYHVHHKATGGSIAEFVRSWAMFNKENVPRSRQRGATGTDVKALDHHLRELLRTQRRNQAE